MLNLEKIGKNFDSSPVIKGLSCTIKRGEFVSIVGESGCGKSTLLNMIAGLSSISHGKVAIDSTPSVDNYSGSPVLVFQDYGNSLFPWLTAYRNIEVVIERRVPKMERADVIQKYLALVGLSDSNNKYPWEMSGGMQQRLALARALVVKPKLLLMDEPFGSLDSNTKRQMSVLLLKIWKELDLTILMVTHDLTDAVFLSNRVLVMGGNPSNIIDDINIDLDYPREYLSVIESERFSVKLKSIFQYFSVAS